MHNSVVGNVKNDLLYRHLYRQSGKSGFPTGVHDFLLFYHEVVVCIRRVRREVYVLVYRFVLYSMLMCKEIFDVLKCVESEFVPL